MAACWPPHGQRNRYALGCRCDDCREAARLYYKRWREGRLPAGRVDSTGTARRLQALAADGWTWPLLAIELRTTERWPSMLANQRNATVTIGTYSRVRAVYEALKDTPGPSPRARLLAARRGWLPPSAWEGLDIDDPADPDAPDDSIDEVAVQRAVRGDRNVIQALRDQERRAAAAELRACGYGAERVARLLDLPERKVRAMSTSRKSAA